MQSRKNLCNISNKKTKVLVILHFGYGDTNNQLEAIGLAHRSKLESAEALGNEDGMERIINYLDEG